jgi:hypothetical protein
MPGCDLNYAHAPVWCDACWEDERRGKELKSREQYNKLLAEQNELLEEELDLEFKGMRRPRREPPSPPPPPVPGTVYGQRGGMAIEPQ